MGNPNVSYWHYQRDFGQQDGATLADALIGFTPFGSWSDYLDAWSPMERPGTLLLRYEQLIDDPQQQIQRISEFFELQPLHEWKNDFETLQRLDPRFFREGSDAPPPNFEEAEESLFWLMHGAWMTRMGYVPSDELPAAASQEVRQLVYQSIARHQWQLNSLSWIWQSSKSRPYLDFHCCGRGMPCDPPPWQGPWRLAALFAWGLQRS